MNKKWDDGNLKGALIWGLLLFGIFFFICLMFLLSIGIELPWNILGAVLGGVLISAVWVLLLKAGMVGV